MHAMSGYKGTSNKLHVCPPGDPIAPIPPATSTPLSLMQYAPRRN